MISKISEEFKIYQLEKLPSSFTEVKTEQKKTNRASYWRYAYGLLDESIENEGSTGSTIHYWSKIGTLTDEEGKSKYLNLCKLTKCVATIAWKP